MVSEFLQQDTFNLQHYLESLQKAEKRSAGGWKSFVPGVSKAPELADIRKQIKIIEAMSADEREDPSSIRRNAKRRIASASGAAINEVNLVMKGFDGALSMYEWISYRKNFDLPLPTSLTEAYDIMMVRILLFLWVSCGCHPFLLGWLMFPPSPTLRC